MRVSPGVAPMFGSGGLADSGLGPRAKLGQLEIPRFRGHLEEEVPDGKIARSPGTA
jgi:hypothetical protein